MIQETTCPECRVKTTAWVRGLQTPEQRNFERACAEHKPKYKRLLDKANKLRESLQAAVGHVHTDACYSRVPETEGRGGYLSCGKVAGAVEQETK